MLWQLRHVAEHVFPSSPALLLPHDESVFRANGGKEFGREKILNSELYHFASIWPHIEEFSG
jgi:hypothetical protein